MEVSPTLDIISAVVPTSQGGTEVQSQTDISYQPDPFQPTDSGPAGTDYINNYISEAHLKPK